MTDATLASRPVGGLRGLAARRPLTVYLLLVAVTGWPIMWLIPLVKHGVIPLAIDIEHPASFGLVLCMFASALWVTWAGEGRDGIKRLLSRSFRWRFGWPWYALVIFALPLIGLGAGLVIGGTLKPVAWPSVLLNQLWIFSYTLLLINLWEETVWAGFFQTRLEQRHTIVVAAALTAVPFIGVHLPLLFANNAIEPVQLTIAFVALTFLGAIFRLMLGVVMRGAANSLLAVGMLHAAFNRTNNPDGFLVATLDGVSSGVCALVAIVLVLGIAFLCTRGKLSRAYRLGLND